MKTWKFLVLIVVLLVGILGTGFILGSFNGYYVIEVDSGGGSPRFPNSMET